MNNLFQINKFDENSINNLKFEFIKSTNNIKIIKKLSNDENYYFREIVALNPNCPIEILKKLSNDEEYLVSEIAALNPTWIKYNNE